VDTGSGLAPQRGEGRLVSEPIDVLAGRDEQRGGVTGRYRDAGDGDRCRLGDELLELAVERPDLAVEIADVSRERPECRLGRLLGMVQAPLVRAKARAEGRAGAGRLASQQLLAQIPRSGDDETAERVECGAARLDRAVASDAQLTDRFHDAGRVLGDHGAVGGQDVAGGHLGVGRVALAPPAAGVRMGLVDFKDLQAEGVRLSV